jgi:hypothetical protein
VQILIRLRAGRCFYADPPPPKRTGRPPRHGPKLDTKEPRTWPTPSAEHSCEDAGYGTVRVRAWAGLHPKTQDHPTRGTRRPRPIVRGTLVLVEVSHLPRPTREPRKLWLWWAGPRQPDLRLLWRAYVRRFDLEHTFRFLKQTLGWTTPRVRHPQQADLWSWLVLAAFTQLRLARPYVADRRLPKAPEGSRRLPKAPLGAPLCSWLPHTPLRVRRGVLALLLEVGTPAKPPKPCGRSPGRPKGRRSGRARRYPAIKKTA